MGASVSMLAPSVPLSSSSPYASESGYSSYPIFSFALSVGRVRGFCPLTTVAGRPVFAISSSLLACLSWEAEGGSFLASSNISKKSSRRRGCDQGSGVPSTLSLYFSKICLCAAFAVLGRGLLAQRPGDWETFWRADALLTGEARSRRPIAWADAGDAATAAQLIFTSAPTLAW